MLDVIARLRENIGRVFLGHPDIINRVIACLLARGHLLIEDVPGVGKTVLATALARSLDCSFARIQLTPDMLPSDVVGVTIYDRTSSEFVFKRGPIFANVVLADEINRTTPRTQTALLEAMNEGQVSIDGRVLELDRPFMLLATQNPYEFEGTYLLPENQLDRFLLRIRVGYPRPEDEARVLELRPSNGQLHDLKPVLSKAEVIALQERVDGVRLERSLQKYIVEFANATRKHEALEIGVSPRGSLALAQAARATALMDARDYVVPEDITSCAVGVCAHRVIGRSTLRASNADETERIITRILEAVPSPV